MNNTTNNRDISRRKGSKGPCCFNYFFHFCRNHEPDHSLESSDNVNGFGEEHNKILVTQHYSTQVNNSLIANKSVKKSLLPNGPFKYIFKYSQELSLFNNMHILLTFHSNMFLLTWQTAGVLAKFSLKLIKLGKSYSENFSFERAYLRFQQKFSKKSQNSAKSSLNNEIEVSRTYSKRAQKILQETIHIISKKVLEDVAVVIDFSCNEGTSAIAWAHEGAQVLLIEDNPFNLQRAKGNILISGEKAKIDMVYAKMDDIKAINESLVFFQPDPSLFQRDEEFGENSSGMHKFILMNLRIKIAKCLKITENLVILLPKCCELNELAAIFTECFEENKIKPLDFTLQIELIYVNNRLESYLVCYGSLFKVNKEEETNFFLTALFQDSDSQQAFELRQMFKNLISKIGVFNATQCLSALYHQMQRSSNLEISTKNFSFDFIQEAYNLGFLKESLRNEYSSRYKNIQNNEKTSEFKDSFSFNPHNNAIEIKNNNELSPLEWETPYMNHSKLIGSSENTKGIEGEGEGYKYSPSSYSGILNSRESSSKFKESFKEEECNVLNNLIIVEKEFN